MNILLFILLLLTTLIMFSIIAFGIYFGGITTIPLVLIVLIGLLLIYLCIKSDETLHSMFIMFFLNFFKVNELGNYYIGEKVRVHENCFIDLQGYIYSFYNIFGEYKVAIDCTRKDLKGQIPNQIEIVSIDDITSLDKQKIANKKNLLNNIKKLMNEITR